MEQTNEPEDEITSLAVNATLILVVLVPLIWFGWFLWDQNRTPNPDELCETPAIFRYCYKPNSEQHAAIKATQDYWGAYDATKTAGESATATAQAPDYVIDGEKVRIERYDDPETGKSVYICKHTWNGQVVPCRVEDNQ